MTAPNRGPNASGATAGILLLTTIVLFTAAGAGIGALVGLFAPLLLLGLFAGFVAGILVVRARFRDL